MSRAETHRFLNKYEQEVNDCRGDLRGAVMALMLINEQLEQTLQRLCAVLIEKPEEDHRQHLLH